MTLLTQYKDKALLQSDSFSELMRQLEDFRYWLKGMAHSSECYRKQSCPQDCCATQLNAISAFVWDLSGVFGEIYNYLGAARRLSFNPHYSNNMALDTRTHLIRAQSIARASRILMTPFYRIKEHLNPTEHRIFDEPNFKELEDSLT